MSDCRHTKIAPETPGPWTEWQIVQCVCLICGAKFPMQAQNKDQGKGLWRQDAEDHTLTMEQSPSESET